MKRADQYAAELIDSFGDQRCKITETEYPLDPECSHRPTKRKQKYTKGCKKRKRSSRFQTQLSSSSSEESLQSPTSLKPKTKRNSRYRGQRSKTFELSLQKAKNCKTTIQLTQSLDLCDEKLFSVTRPVCAHENVAPIYHIKIGKNPTCTCPFAQKKNVVCKHRLWVMLFLLHVPDDSYLLQQMAFTADEVDKIFQNGSQLKHQSGSQQSTSPWVNQSNITHNFASKQAFNQSASQQAHQVPGQLYQSSTSQETSGYGHRFINEKATEKCSVTPEQCSSDQIFQKHPQIWKLRKHKKKPGRVPMCAGCRNHSFTENELQITVNGFYIPKNTEFCVSREYHFCVDLACLSHKPPGSNLKTPPMLVEVDACVDPCDVERALELGIPIF